MHLHDHFAGIAIVIQPGLHPNHGALDDIRRGTLHRGIDRGTFSILAYVAVTSIDIGQVQPASEHGFDVALVSRPLLGFFHVAPDPRIAFEIGIYILLCLVATDIQLFAETKSRHAIDQAKIDRLGRSTFLGAYFIQGGPENFRGGCAMHIQSLGKSIEQAFVGRQVRHDTQLDLGVIQRQNLTTRWRHESFADASPLGGTHRYVLQVRTGRRQPPGRGNRLLVGGMHAPGVRIDLLRQLDDVGRHQLVQAAVLENQCGYFVIRSQLFEHVFRCRRLPLGRLAQHR